jgi:hypothetical protein
MGRSSVITIEPNNGMPFSTFNVLKEYLQIRPVFDGPLYCYLNRTSLTRKQCVHVLHASLKFMGYTTVKFNKHSFWIGTATYLSKLGYSDEEIQKRGRWLSNSSMILIQF